MVAKDFISMQNTIKKYLLKDISREELAGIVSVINNHNSTYFEEEICYPMGEFDKNKSEGLRILNSVA
jgi:hypothetical protein